MKEDNDQLMQLHTNNTALEVQGADTYESRVQLNLSPEARSFNVIGNYLYERGFKHVRLLTNNPLKIEGLRSSGIVVDTLPLIVPSDNPHVHRLYETKARRFGHKIPPTPLCQAK